MAEQKFTGVRLPTNVKPNHYDLIIKPDLKKFTFEGKVKINYTAESSNPIKEVVVNSLDLVITKGHVQTTTSETTILMTNCIYSKESEAATLEFGSAIPAEGIICLEFTGILNDKMSGFYRTSFKIDNVSINAATTQFESTYARWCFPCWDEPAIKATFSVTLIYDRLTKVQEEGGKSHEYTNVAISNTPVIEHIDDPSSDVITTKFDKTPIMSTYLLAFVVGPFESIEGSDGKRLHRVFTAPGKKETARFALEVGCKALIFYENYFNIEYPLKKMDQIAIPDFSSGAMENWGLVTYRESCLLVDPKNTATAVKQNVALVVAHELAHQWFGNLVTMEWWTHLWLNEGFATFMEYLCVASILPDFDIWSQFATNVHASALELDALHNSHPIEVPVNHPSEISEIFDEISYSKGAAVIRMLYQYIGDDCFRRGMHDYLTKYSYKNAITEQLWECLEAASNKPVIRIMSGWTSQKGFPWLSVAYSKEGGDSVKLSLTQSKFAADGTLPVEDAGSTWLIPIDAVTGSNPKKLVSLGLLEGKDNVMTVEGVSDSWIKLNAGGIGLYRTAYPDEMLKKLFQAISSQGLPAMDRHGILDDFFALCHAGKVKSTDLLELLEAYKGEINYTVWRTIDCCFGYFNSLLSNTNYQDKLHAFGRNIYAEIFKKLTWSPKAGENDADAMTRTLILNRLVSFGEPSVIEEAKRRYKAQLDNVESIPADLRNAVYRAVACYGDDETFASMFESWRATELNEERNRLARCMALTKDPARRARVLSLAFSDEVKNQDKIFFIMPISSVDPSAAWELLQEKKDKLIEMYETGHLLTRVVKFCTENFASEERAQEVSSYFEANKFPGCERTIQQSIETIRLNANWLARDKDSMELFLAA